MNVTYNFLNGDVFIDGLTIRVNDQVGIYGELNNYFKENSNKNDDELELRGLVKLTTLSTNGSLVIRIRGKKITSICFLFDEIVFFEKSILESKIIKKFEIKYKTKVISTHPAIGQVGMFSWGTAEFKYDPRQGDLNLCLHYSDS